MSLALLGNALTFFARKRLQALRAQTKAWGGLYEGYLDDPFGKCFRPFLVDRIAFRSPHS